MREVLYEESANPNNLKLQKVIYVIYSVLFWALTIFSCFVFFTEFFITDFDFLLVFLVPTAFLFWFIRSKIYYCVDTIFVSGSTRIVKVINYKRRKKIIIFEAKEVLQVGKITSDSFEKVLATPGVKKVYATPNKYIDEGFYVFLNQNGQHYVVILECKEDYLSHLVNFTGRQVIEKDYK
ncbi:MAG: hypothetical protein IJW64_06900 [Clostridia bacterium]|nr:hypothetical protein [Clostridia bacterium]